GAHGGFAAGVAPGGAPLLLLRRSLRGRVDGRCREGLSEPPACRKWPPMRSRARRQEFYVQAALPAPALIIVAAAIAYPPRPGLWFSLSDAQLGQVGNFVGLANSPYLLRQPTYQQALMNTLIYTLASITI